MADPHVPHLPVAGYSTTAQDGTSALPALPPADASTYSELEIQSEVSVGGDQDFAPISSGEALAPLNIPMTELVRSSTASNQSDPSAEARAELPAPNSSVAPTEPVSDEYAEPQSEPRSSRPDPCSEVRAREQNFAQRHYGAFALPRRDRTASKHQRQLSRQQDLHQPHYQHRIQKGDQHVWSQRQNCGLARRRTFYRDTVARITFAHFMRPARHSLPVQARPRVRLQ